MRTLVGATVAGWVMFGAGQALAEWKPGNGPLMTRWAADVSPDNVLPEYPRPQMVRATWMNLNGLWDYAVAPKDAAQPAFTEGQILVPFPIESALSGVMRRVNENERLWYRRSFTVPQDWGKDSRLILHFGAVDWETVVYVNGREIGQHRGGYAAFSFDITDALREASEQELVVAVVDPTDAGYQPRGKQVRNPRGIWYTPTTGIWQTVWLEPVAASHLRALRITPDLDASTVTVQANAVASGHQTRLLVEVLDGDKVVRREEVKKMPTTRSIPAQVAPSVTLPISEVKPWSPDSPFLYGLRVTLIEDEQAVDQVTSYFGMRKIALTKDSDGIQRLSLNNSPLFQYGPLDQGFWPDGLYTAPTDAALRYDIEVTKQLGFNMARKHVKIEPARWYYWCDKLGLLVWQDMPSGDKYIRGDDPDIQRSPESARNFEAELKQLVDGYYNHPSIVMWVPYNEGWGQWDTSRIVDLIRSWDSTRLVDSASGWTDRGVGDVMDIHRYPGPAAPRLEADRASVLGEFGGLGLPIIGHTWQNEKNWGYRSYKNADELTEAYLELVRKLHPLTGKPGLAAAVYTQTTDVEIEVNGLLTYDRAVIKMDPDVVAKANAVLYAPPVTRETVGNRLVPPATPLVACDPYFSIWSQADRLTDEETTHWTGKPHRMGSLVRVDGQVYRVMGATPARVPALEQSDLVVLPTRTIYQFEGAGIGLSLEFMTAALPEDIELLARPVTYLTWKFYSLDGKTHDVELYFDAMGEIAVNTPDQAVEWSTEAVGGLAVAKVGSVNQPVLGRSGDDIRIDWGYLYVAAPEATVQGQGISTRPAFQRSFVQNEFDPALAPLSSPMPGGEVCAGTVIKVGAVGKEAVSRWLMVAYDDIFSIQYMHRNLRPYWRRNGWEAADLLQAASRDYAGLRQRCAAFDEALMADLTRVGGERYAKICALAFRQCFAASKFVADANGQPLSFSKENHSNGCIGTSDVFYPMAPQFLLFGPSLAKSFIVPFMNYAASDRWTFPFAPHDLGQYPHANGQVYGGGETSEENQMPVEESGNLLILMGAVAEMEGNADFASLYWPVLERWAAYLRDKGFDPENQLCTDDFAGHLAHNVNLSAKAIAGLASFSKLCELRGETAKALEYRKLAQTFAQEWMDAADDGDHFRLAFDKPGTWSQKYNLVWDRILRLDVFPQSVKTKEMAYYRRVQNLYGLPLDNRSDYTKLDWVLWTATLTQDPEDFRALVDPVFRFLNETPDRVPMTDWYWTHTGRRRGFTARPVVGGVFLQMLYQGDLWKKYAGRDVTRASGFAAMPKPPVIDIIVPASNSAAQSWHYTERQPAADWMKTGFDDSQWRQGPGGFGTEGTPSAVVGTTWESSDIWLRRRFNLDNVPDGNLRLWLHHDEDAEVFLNGELAARVSGYTMRYQPTPLSESARRSLRQGINVIAVHCHQTSGGQFIDVGMVVEKAVD